MPIRPVNLIAYRQSSRQRAHFAIWIPYADVNSQSGTIIHVVGLALSGFHLEFKRAYDPSTDDRPMEMYQIGEISAQHVYDWADGFTIDAIPRSNVETVAIQIAPPGRCEDIRALVNETTNRRCQEWTMEFVKRLVELGYLEGSAADIVQSKRDSPTHGIVGLRAGTE